MTAKQQAFVDEYLANGGNATEAARKAYECTDDNTAGAIGSENLRKPKIREAIEEVQRKEQAQAHMDFHELMGHLADMIRDKDFGASRVSASKTYANLMGWEPEQRLRVEDNSPIKTIVTPPGVKIVTDPEYDADV